ncbi:diaminopimelate decarboxylase [Gemmatimonadota bacterium]
MSDPFPRLDGELRCGEYPVSEFAARFGTPLYLYNTAAIRERYDALLRAFDDVKLTVAYSVKANGNLGLLSFLSSMGSGADIVSGGELYRARRAGIPSEKIVFAGVGKTREELTAALEEGIYSFNVESEEELETLAQVADGMGRPAPFAIRVNLDILAPTPHHYTRTGHAKVKFGVPVPTAMELYRRAAGDPRLLIRGITVHIGSQIVESEPYLRALEGVLEVVDALESEGIALDFIDLGGGYGVEYQGEERMNEVELAESLVPLIRERPHRLILEPGRFLVGEAGLLLTRVLYVKWTESKTFVITDAGMSELLRPSHYQGYHHIEPVVADSSRKPEVVDVVGPICEAGDFFALDRTLPTLEAGELLAIRTAGAYGFAMSSNYNARLRPAEVMVDGGAVDLIRHRESLEDLVRGEIIPGEG